MSVEDKKTDTASQTSLDRALGLFTGTLLVAGIMIGSGVFKKIVPMAQTGLNETWILVAWIIAGIMTMFSAFNLAGLSSLTEESGGIYEYLRLSFGNFFSFLFGWSDFAIIGAASVAALGFIFAQTINSFIPLPNPFQAWMQISIGHSIFPFADSGVKIVAIATIVVLTWVNYRGVKQSGIVNNIFTSAKILGILFLIIIGLFLAAPHYHGHNETNIATNYKQGNSFISIFFVAMLSAFWAYDGWLDLSFVTGEIKNPKRNVPLAIIMGVSIAMTLYVLVNYAYMHTLPLHTIAALGDNEIGAAAVAETLVGSIGETLISGLIMVCVFGAINAIILSHSRIYFRMAQENYFFKKAAQVHPRFRTPHIALMYTMIWSCMLVISGTFDLLTDMVIFATFLFYGLLAIALIKMKRNGMIKVKVTGYPVIQVVILLFATTLTVNTIATRPRQTLAGIALMLTGVPFYFYFKRTNSKN
jgi:APA family basic amino acid/polyamine antiporter